LNTGWFGMSKVLVVDDSALMRRQIRRILDEAGFDVIIARHGVEALEMIELEKPDVVTLDINMPEMDGLTFLSRLMTTHPVPVVMVSSLTEEGALATLEAMELGAVDYIHKPDGTVSHNIDKVRDEIVAKVKAAVGARPRRSRGLRERLRSDRGRQDERAAAVRQRQGVASSDDFPVVLIGVSTGGPSTVEEIVTALLCPPIFPARSSSPSTCRPPSPESSPGVSTTSAVCRYGRRRNPRCWRRDKSISDAATPTWCWSNAPPASRPPPPPPAPIGFGIPASTIWWKRR